ncbi:hypothetical protein ABB07_38085 [Streptomyces incarnatus]|uniref:Uncharacterized protein n=1 Tax=Streptomyces incarnatus TaxID=665007 RepID=A0ABN4GT10_9ACTN|nr:hypothetical protein ABB07_38085 [Streptomyces incarnatus]
MVQQLGARCAHEVDEERAMAAHGAGPGTGRAVLQGSDQLREPVPDAVGLERDEAAQQSALAVGVGEGLLGRRLQPVVEFLGDPLPQLPQHGLHVQPRARPRRTDG